jgi:hypothetical protein
MLRRFIPLSACFTLMLALASPASGVGPIFPPEADPNVGLTIQVELYGWRIDVDNKVPNVSLTLTVTAADGVLKFKQANKDASSSTSFALGQIVPGDRIRLQQGAVDREWTMAAIGFSGNPTTDTVTGKVSPRKDSVKVYGFHMFLNPTPSSYDIFFKDASLDAAGKFSLNVSDAGDIRRRTSLFVYYREANLLLYRQIPVPGLELSLSGSGLHFFALPAGKNYDLRLLSPAGAVKALSRTTVSNQTEGFNFLKPSGRPVFVESGDTVQVIGPGGFSAKVKLAVEHPPTGNVTTVRTRPGSAVALWLDIHDPVDGHFHGLSARGSAGDDGAYTVNWGAALPVGTRELRVDVEEPGGNRFQRILAIPSPI